MKRIAYVFLAVVVLTGMLVTMAAAQSEPLGDYARSIRKDDKKEVTLKGELGCLLRTQSVLVLIVARNLELARQVLSCAGHRNVAISIEQRDHQTVFELSLSQGKA